MAGCGPCIFAVMTYAALVCESLSDDLSGLAIRSLPLPVPGPGQVLVKVRAAALNFPDFLMTQGRYQFKPELPFVPGLEAAGEVMAVGAGVGDVKAGDAVVAHARTGAIAECMLVGQSEVRAIPSGLDFADAAAFHAAAITAYVALVRRAALQAGETLLVHGASGGVGMATVQVVASEDFVHEQVEAWELGRAAGPHVHHITDDLAR